MISYKNALEKIEEVQEGPFSDDWDSLGTTKSQSGIGMLSLHFIHWGVYGFLPSGMNGILAVYPLPESNTYQDVWNHKDFGIRTLFYVYCPQIRSAGMGVPFKEAVKYVPVAEHHDGFQMYKSDLLGTCLQYGAQEMS